MKKHTLQHKKYTMLRCKYHIDKKGHTNRRKHRFEPPGHSDIKKSLNQLTPPADDLWPPSFNGFIGKLEDPGKTVIVVGNGACILLIVH